ncbi:uncharacterized protein LOC112349180 isoform X2 [Selaginella moellendorffii]|uniref:uncharacterized protein LOC112349180 isoform X2 n=1 Tax=Selaginella moellendorffii TaxID=88036 RepID=UPI000D1CA7B7|nr:uncharacterized protein LOC112349180 isoform X2 [Selaginella moellendorffii]|eukprot:XP_024538857.1 uncharacterized protein LOC112349180 isoform X2 [Selaginella moellendorffii]
MDRAEIELQVEDHSIRLKREIVIEIPKKELISKLCSSIIAHRDDFLLLCDKLEQIIALQYRSRRENLTMSMSSSILLAMSRSWKAFLKPKSRKVRKCLSLFLLWFSDYNIDKLSAHAQK